tara:strand:+ start:109000 stop:109599 length:600 start_codon:yes stop_codon:yes gene_type:complete
MSKISQRFREFLPIVVDVETGGVNPQTDALLELAAVSLKMDDQGVISPDKQYHYHILPFKGANLDPVSLNINKIDPFHPFRFAISEEEALNDLFPKIKKECKVKNCQRAVLVGHNAWFDLHFLQAAQKRCRIEKSPFHRFTSFDTATLSALVYGQTVLAKALQKAKLPYAMDSAHSALYDTERTAELFCKIVNETQVPL